jgi:hypothetical protein
MSPHVIVTYISHFLSLLTLYRRGSGFDEGGTLQDTTRQGKIRQEKTKARHDKTGQDIGKTRQRTRAERANTSSDGRAKGEL